MIVFKEAITLKKHLRQLKEAGKSIGCVPTMGALHPGHISLIERSKQECDISVCSIFVNPIQFNDPSDFEKYPITISNDIGLLENEGCDIVFLPSVEEIYPDGTNFNTKYHIGSLENHLEGKYRPGHFQGVCRVVHRLLDIIHPHILFVGQKDYQQYLVIKKLVQLIKKNVEVRKVVTYRENTGLALSSRNMRLTKEQKEKAGGLFKMLDYIEKNITALPHSQLQKNSVAYLLRNGFSKVDYVEIADAETLVPITDNFSRGKVVALIAAFIGDVRLIDNKILQEAININV